MITDSTVITLKVMVSVFIYLFLFISYLGFYTNQSNLVTWTNWAENEPGPSVEIEDCVQFITKSRYNILIDGRWNDVPCDKTIPNPERPRVDLK